MSASNVDAHVHVGIWTNWSRGSVFGATLTLPRDEGNLVIAFTASFIAFVATCFWHIICVSCHRIRSNVKANHPLHHQRQVVLRNSANAEAGLIGLLLLVSAWWRSAGLHRLASILPELCLASATVAGFTIAGGFSSTITSAVGDVVLLDSANCGFPLGNSAVINEEDKSNQTAFNTEKSEYLSSSLNYAQQCYTQDPVGTLNCERFLRQNLSSQTIVDTQAPCPFTDGMCESTDKNIRLDSGLMNTDDALGLNAPPDERSALRYTLHCAPLKTEGFKSTFIYDDLNATVTQYNYGPVMMANLDGELEPTEFSHQEKSLDSQYAYLNFTGASTAGGLNFRATARLSLTIDGKPYPVPGYLSLFENMTQSNGDVALIFLTSNGILFDSQWDDDWYRTGVKSPPRQIGGTIQTFSGYQAAEPASPLGCVESWQVCNLGLPGDSGCGPLASLNDYSRLAAPYFNFTNGTFSPTEAPAGNRDATRLWWIMSIVGLYQPWLGPAVSVLGAISLASQGTLNSGVQYRTTPSAGPMWHLDVQNWFHTSLAGLQTAFMLAPIGPMTPAASEFRVGPTSEDGRRLCNSQKVRSSAYTSFSLFGICFTYSLGALIVLVSFALEPALGFLHRRRGRGYQQQYAHLEWATNNALQLQRLAQEQRGYGNWTGCDEEVPVTRAEEGQGPVVLGNLDFSDPKHPVIAAPSEQHFGQNQHSRAALARIVGETHGPTGKGEKADSELLSEIQRAIDEGPRGSEQGAKSFSGTSQTNIISDGDTPSHLNTAVRSIRHEDHTP